VANIPTELDLTAIRLRDARAGELWFKGPESFTSLAARDRRALLRQIDQLRADLAQKTANTTSVLQAQHERDCAVEKLAELSAVLEPARNWFSSVDDTRRTQEAIDKFRDAARAALDVGADGG
jgi:hypothetical protein